MHYVPDNGLYVYFRYTDKQTIMCVMNTDTKERIIDFSRFPERTKGFAKAENVLSKEVFNTAQKPTIASMRMLVLELKR